VAEHPRLNNLIRLPDLSTYDAYRVLDCYPPDRCLHQQPHELESFGLLLLLVFKPPRTAGSQMCAWRVRHHQIPTMTKNLSDVFVDVVGAGVIRR
jgi:hypothetical protein